MFKRLSQGRRGRRSGSPLGRFSRFRRGDFRIRVSDIPVIGALLITGMALWFLDPSSAFSSTPAWAMPARFINTELALPNFLKVVGAEAGSSRVLDLAELNASEIQAWGGQVVEQDFDEADGHWQSSGSPEGRWSATSLYSSVGPGDGGSTLHNALEAAGSAPRITSGFGFRKLGGVTRHHNGIDIAMAYGSPITARWSGEVVYAGWHSGYGLAVLLGHGQGKESLYAHASSLRVQPGDIVRAGDIIGFVGTTGRSFGPHLHFEVRYDNIAVDPEEEFLRGTP